MRHIGGPFALLVSISFCPNEICLAGLLSGALWSASLPLIRLGFKVVPALPGGQLFFLTVGFMGLWCVVPFSESVQEKMGLLVGRDHLMFLLCPPSSANLSANSFKRSLDGLLF